MGTAGWYLKFGRETHGYSPAYERLALAVARDRRLIELLDRLPEPKRQPNLLFAAARQLGGPVEDPTGFRQWAVRHWDDLATIMRARRTQTNEPARCATLLPVLARLPQPIALLEVGASAGLCLYPDRYRYRYGNHEVGPADSPVRIDCAIAGPVPLPKQVPTVAWRAGLDLNPLDLTRDEDLRWLDALIWPEHEHRRARLRAAVEVVRADPPRLVRGDLLTDLPRLAGEAPAEATLVIFHSSVLGYVPVASRAGFIRQVRALDAHWISNESHDVLPDVTRPPSGDPASHLLALDGRPVAVAASHGQSLRWVELPST